MAELIAVMTSPRTKTASVRLHIIEVARELENQAFAIVAGIVESDERFLRDQLDHKSAAVPRLVRQAAETESQIDRRVLYARARRTAIDCAAILDGLGKQGAIAAEPLNECRTIASRLSELLGPLTMPPPLAR